MTLDKDQTKFKSVLFEHKLLKALFLILHTPNPSV